MQVDIKSNGSPAWVSFNDIPMGNMLEFKSGMIAQKRSLNSSYEPVAVYFNDCTDQVGRNDKIIEKCRDLGPPTFNIKT